MVNILNLRRMDCCSHQVSKQLLQHTTGAWLFCVRNSALLWKGGYLVGMGAKSVIVRTHAIRHRFGLHPCFHSYCLWAHCTCTKTAKDPGYGNESSCLCRS